MDGGATRDFQAVYEEHYGEVRALIGSLIEDADIADDLTRETFANAYRAWSGYDARSSPPLSEWLLGIARSNVRNYEKRREQG